MPTRPRFALSIVLLLAMLLPIPAAAALRQAPPLDPAAAGSEIRSALFDAQAALLAGDADRAAAGVAQATTTADALAPAFTVDPGAATALGDAMRAAETAVAAGDGRALALAQGEAWAALVRGSCAEAVAAATAGNADAASTWLLLRDFRPTTIFARPNADATLAIKGLAEGTVAPADAALAIRADLLDTYQARLETALDGTAAIAPRDLSPSQAEAVGLASGSWPILASALAEQQGDAARAEADAAFAALAESARAGDAAGFADAATTATGIVQGFRAAPLTETEQGRRAGQLLRYLSLVPVEYGRGVKDGQIILDIEIQEAQAFLAAARAAFADLRLPLRDIDPDATAAIDAALVRLDGRLAGAATYQDVASADAIESETAAAAAALAAIVPPAWAAAGGDADFDVVASILDQMVAAVAAGQYQQAESARIEAYAAFETGPEKRLLAFAPTAAQRVEQLFWEGDGSAPGLQRVLADRGDVAAVRAARQALEVELTEAQRVLGSGETAPAAIVFNAATIVFREGLEGVLILASLLASMIGANRGFKKPLALGAGAALVVSAALFVLAGGALRALGGYGEKLEAVVSLVAIGVLLLVMNWFFHKVYWTRWIGKHHERRRRLLVGGYAGQALGFALLGFSSVFREGAETVLFLQALVLEAGTWIVVQGTLIGLAATAVVGALTLVLQTKLPHKKMLIATGIMIAAVLVTMVGSTVQVLQMVGWAPITPVRGLEGMPYWLGVWLGVYPTWQGIAAQVAAGVFVVGSYVAAEHAQKRTRPPVAASVPAASAAPEVARGSAEGSLKAT